MHCTVVHIFLFHNTIGMTFVIFLSISRRPSASCALET